MKLTILSENNTYTREPYLMGEPGFCCYIECAGRRLLLDTGYYGIALKNAETLGIDLNGLDCIAISHGHDDHTHGLLPLLESGLDISRAKLVVHPQGLRRKLVDGADSGFPWGEEEIRRRFDVQEAAGPLELAENLWYLGAIPRVNDFENKSPIGFVVTEDGQQADFLTDDTALAYRAEEGVFVITGCSHSGICNICEYAKQVLGDDRLLGVIGGFHLLQEGRQLEETIRYFDREKPSLLCPCHCISMRCKFRMAQALPIEDIAAGFTLQLR
ncbi:MAG: MBL fold metallo-hydrolase [Clostridia bacterium]|nr:MBL fold metallo-hydrolase [Clostridia bacterium]